MIVLQRSTRMAEIERFRIKWNGRGAGQIMDAAAYLLDRFTRAGVPPESFDSSSPVVVYQVPWNPRRQSSIRGTSEIPVENPRLGVCYGAGLARKQEIHDGGEWRPA